MALDTTLHTALQAPSLRVFFAVQIDLPSGPLRLIDGDGTVRFSVDGSTVDFTGSDGVYGSIASIGGITEAIATSAPVLDLSILPPTEGALGELSQIEAQGSLIRVWFGVLNESTGLPLGTPELVWIGHHDRAVITEAPDARVIEITVMSAWERFFAAQEGERLNDVWHQGIHPGDDFLKWNTQVTMSQPWGMNSPTPQPGSQPRTTYPGSGGNGGGGGGRIDPYDGFDRPGLDGRFLF